MTKFKQFLKTALPLFDQLYIFQIMEYNSLDFWGWFLQNPWERDLQKKHHLEKTPKALILALISLILMIILAAVLGIYVFDTLLASVFIFLLLQFLTPVFLIISQKIFSPLENYQKQRLLQKSQKKLGNLENLKVVAITGSFAKTSTKDMLYTLLWKKFRVVKTPKSFNTEVSIARTILEDLKDNTEVFLAEMDAYSPGEINKLASLVKPQIGLITAIAPQHLSRFGSMERLAQTQFEIENQIKENGILFLNSSDEWTMKLLTQDAKFHIKNRRGEIKFFGFNPKAADIFATNIKQHPQGLEFILHKGPDEVKISLPLYGEHHVLNFLASAAVALELGLSLAEIRQRAAKILATPHRLEIKKQGNLVIIDNSYNTNPVVSQTSLKLLKDFPGVQKILITPGLVELGKISFEANQDFAQAAAKVADKIIIVGENAKAALLAGLNQAKFPEKNTLVVGDLKQAMQLLGEIAKAGDVVLLENDLPDQYF